MRAYRIYLTSVTELGGLQSLADPPVALAQARRDRRALTRAYRSYIAGDWLPAPPVRVRLRGPEREAAQPAKDYELSFFAGEPSGVVQRVQKAVAAAAVVVMGASSVIGPLSGAAYAMREDDGAMGNRKPQPPSVDLERSVPGGPPSRTLASPLTPALDGQGRPVRLAAFHANTPGTPHANISPTPHSNINEWTNHSNTPQAHTNAWSNHANVPGYTIPHTNIVPGDFIF